MSLLDYLLSPSSERSARSGQQSENKTFTEISPLSPHSPRRRSDGPAKVDSLCRYDWVPGYQGARLHCVVHRHSAGTDTVVGQDTMADMRRLGVLTGQALVAAEQVPSQEPQRVEARCPRCRGEKRCPSSGCIEGLGEVESAPCRVCGGRGTIKQWVQ